MTNSTEQAWLDMIEREGGSVNAIERAVCVNSFELNGRGVGYSLKIFAPTSKARDQRFTLSGEVYGFDVSKFYQGRMHANFNGGGNYGAEAWLKQYGAESMLAFIEFDSESGNFFAYSEKAEALVALVHTLGQPTSVS